MEPLAAWELGLSGNGTRQPLPDLPSFSTPSVPWVPHPGMPPSYHSPRVTPGWQAASSLSLSVNPDVCGESPKKAGNCHGLVTPASATE